MCCGTPVIAFEVGGMPDVIQDNITGNLLPFRDTGALGRAIAELITDQEKMNQMSKRCRMMIEDDFRLDVQAKRYRDLFRDLLGKSGRGIPSGEGKDISELFSSKYTVDIDAITGEYFKSLEEKIRIKVRKNFPVRHWHTIRRMIKNILRVIHSHSPQLLRRALLSVGNAVRKNLL